MVKIEEICYGNWFMGYDDRPFKWSLGEFGLLWECRAEIDEIIKSPIPLTPEILEKCGCEKMSQDWDYKLKFGAINLYFRFNSGNVYSELGGIYLVDHISYLHTLQNLYRTILNRDLEINL